MLIPRFSLRWLLAVMTLCAALSLVMSLAVRGRPWAIGVTVGIGSVVLLAVLHVLTFLAAWLLSQVEAALAARRVAEHGVSPFAAPLAPPQGDEPPPLTG